MLSVDTAWGAPSEMLVVMTTTSQTTDLTETRPDQLRDPAVSPHELLAPTDDVPEYHRMARYHATYRWWRPALTLVVALALSVVSILVVGVLATVPMAVLGGEELAVWLGGGTGDQNHPATMLATLLTVAAMMPAVLLAIRWAGGRPAGEAWSVTGRIRWGLLGRSICLALVLYGLVELGYVLTDVARGTFAGWTIQPTAGWMVFSALLLVPFQATAEELAFRALPQQVLGGWLRSPWWGLLLPVPLFVVGHEYNWTGLVDVTVFAVVAGILTWRTGGLEAAIGLHVVNNATIYLLAAVGRADLNATGSTVAELVVTLVLMVAYAAAVLRWQRRLA